jgi:tRNA U34 5-carboxymethylaminomethyl modifying GTPase MnmE/TrmE
LEKARSTAPAHAKVILVGNKSDMGDGREVTRAQMFDYAARIQAVAALEVSACTGEGIDTLRMTLASEAVLSNSAPRLTQWTGQGEGAGDCQC